MKVQLQPSGKRGAYFAELNGERTVVSVRRVNWDQAMDYGCNALFSPEQIRAAKRLATKMGLPFYAVVEVSIQGKFFESYAMPCERWDAMRTDGFHGGKGYEFPLGQGARRVFRGMPDVLTGFQIAFAAAPEGVAA